MKPINGLAGDAFAFVAEEFDGYEESADCYASVAMLLHTGWSP